MAIQSWKFSQNDGKKLLKINMWITLDAANNGSCLCTGTTELANRRQNISQWQMIGYNRCGREKSYSRGSENDLNDCWACVERCNYGHSQLSIDVNCDNFTSSHTFRGKRVDKRHCWQLPYDILMIALRSTAWGLKLEESLTMTPLPYAQKQKQSPDEVCARLGVSVCWLNQWREIKAKPTLTQWMRCIVFY